MTNNSSINKELFDLALKFANDCGEEALGDRDLDKLEQLYKDFAIKVEQLITTHTAQILDKILDELAYGTPDYSSIGTTPYDGYVQAYKEVQQTIKLYRGKV